MKKVRVETAYGIIEMDGLEFEHYVYQGAECSESDELYAQARLLNGLTEHLAFFNENFEYSAEEV